MKPLILIIFTNLFVNFCIGQDDMYNLIWNTDRSYSKVLFTDSYNGNFFVGLDSSYGDYSVFFTDVDRVTINIANDGDTLKFSNMLYMWEDFSNPNYGKTFILQDSLKTVQVNLMENSLMIMHDCGDKACKKLKIYEK